MEQAEPPLIVIVGPTASGKTGLAIDMASRYGGEIISADSRAIYKSLDIGTAKPTPAERRGIPHWAIDIVDVGDTYTVADFKDYANEKIEDIRRRGKVPFLVGGTGLYVDAVLYDYKFGAIADNKLRESLEQLSVHELIDYCIKNNIELPENVNNKRHLTRAIEQGGINRNRKNTIPANVYVVGITTDREQLYQRIEGRIEAMFRDGVVEEATSISSIHGLEIMDTLGNVYKELGRYFRGDITLKQAIEASTVSDKKLVKKQLTWLKRNGDIRWMTLDSARGYIDDVLANNLES